MSLDSREKEEEEEDGLVARLERLLYRGVAMIKCLIEEGRLIAIVLVAKKRATSSPLTFFPA